MKTNTAATLLYTVDDEDAITLVKRDHLSNSHPGADEGFDTGSILFKTGNKTGTYHITFSIDPNSTDYSKYSGTSTVTVHII